MTVTRIESNTNIATFRLINTHTHTNASKKNTHTHTLQYRKKAKKEKHTHTHTPKNTKQSIQKKPTTIRKITYKPYTNLHKISESIKRKDFL